MYDRSKAQKHTFVCCFETKVELLAIEMRLTLLALMFLLFFELATILDKTVEKMSQSQTIFPNILAIPRPPFPPPPGSNVVVCSKATLILRHL